MNFLRNSRSAFSRLHQIARRHCSSSVHPPAAPPSSGTKQTGLLFSGAALFFVGTCHREKVPYTNRVHWVFLPPSVHPKFGNIFFDKVKKKRGHAILGPSDPNAVRVRRIASDIIRGVHDVFPTKSSPREEDDGTPQTRHLDDLDWEVIVINNARVKAYSFPNGKIVIHTGLLDCLKTDAEIAALIAHEAGHIVAKHYMEVSRIIPPICDLLAVQRNEMEADLIGLKLLAAAGFDKHVAHGVYEKFGEIGREWGFHPWCKKE
ncbi:mitochondrial metalloendopeptidase OMA1-like [Triticum aestivum]|uniref:mitochondrial metalloendopeptidase OMA1-like n=1 Tax=Triticum aestivum TaxID=4565 RepID=UPI0008426487|nr:mitochondrial metalloendopeptidase OMA1-like [Triticum aestivum]